MQEADPYGEIENPGTKKLCHYLSQRRSSLISALRFLNLSIFKYHKIIINKGITPNRKNNYIALT